jgi:hypothetical protein
MKNAPFHNGVIPSGRPAIKDYSPDVRRRLSDTVLIYENRVLASDGFPDKDMQYKWARKSWDMTSTGASEQFKLSERMINHQAGEIYYSDSPPHLLTSLDHGSRTSHLWLSQGHHQAAHSKQLQF